MAENLSKLMDNINELLEMIEKESTRQKEILKQLDQVEQPYRLILEKVYIQGKSLVTVASEMGYDYKYMCKMNGTALNKFDNHDKKGLITTQKYVLIQTRYKGKHIVAVREKLTKPKQHGCLILIKVSQRLYFEQSLNIAKQRSGHLASLISQRS